MQSSWIENHINTNYMEKSVTRISIAHLIWLKSKPKKLELYYKNKLLAFYLRAGGKWIQIFSRFFHFILSDSLEMKAYLSTSKNHYSFRFTQMSVHNKHNGN